MGGSKLAAVVGEILPGTPGRKELVIYSTHDRADTLTRNPAEFLGFDITEYATEPGELVVMNKYVIHEGNPFFVHADNIMREKGL